MQARFPALSERQPLLSPPRGAASINSKTTSSVSVESNTYRSNCVRRLMSRFTCKSVTKATIVIILINVFVSLFYSVIINTLTELGCLYGEMGHNSLILHSFLALFGLFYPISGFLADVYCGHYRIIFASVCLMFAPCLILTLCDALIITIIEGGSISFCSTWVIVVQYDLRSIPFLSLSSLFFFLVALAIRLISFHLDLTSSLRLQVHL